MTDSEKPDKKDKPKPRRTVDDRQCGETGGAMTGDGAKDLTDGEKLNLILTKLARTPPASRIFMPPTGIGYEGAVPELIRLRAYRVMKAFGLERYIPAAEIKKPAAKKAKKGAK